MGVGLSDDEVSGPRRSAALASGGSLLTTLFVFASTVGCRASAAISGVIGIYTARGEAHGWERRLR